MTDTRTAIRKEAAKEFAALLRRRGESKHREGDDFAERECNQCALAIERAAGLLGRDK